MYKRQVGYLASEVREAQDRVRTAIRNLGVELPPRKVTINLSPADLRKEGTGFDLAIAAAILTAYGIIPSPEETLSLIHISSIKRESPITITFMTTRMSMWTI